MRRRCAQYTVVLGTLVLGLGAGACTDEVGTAPVAGGTAAQVASPAATGVVRRFAGKSDAFVIDHDRGTVRSEATGREAKLGKAELEKVEKSHDALAAVEAKLERLRQDARFEGAMARAAASKRQLRMRVDLGHSPPPAALVAPRSGGIERGSLNGGDGAGPAATGDPCFELELQIYSVTQQYNAAKAEYEKLLYDLVTLGWGFDGSGAWTFDPLRYASQFLSWVIRSDAVAYQIVQLRSTLDILAFQYEMLGCWNYYSGGGSGTQPPAPPPAPTDPTQPTQVTCRTEYIYLEELQNGTWVTVWEGFAQVCT